ncbi:hemerythrin [Marinobacterium zhoushanense]|uniref:Hemerythrin n=1 Tax=Marinobacterium zhoushanense TaxID=1679163 RepID=A0ABQ1KC89_9GAMM|nr:hemerythrin domain-containing protein [Marinobacterium zhoushanense]GGB95460.1 hemerythrin [Marinobacterium zhoushanense]
MTIMKELHQEHRNLKRLLEMLERKVERFRAGTHPNFQLMSDVVSYVGGYADTQHHPREDRMLAYFQGRDTELDNMMKACEDEHAELKQLSTHLNDSIDGVLHDAAVVPLDSLIDALAEFVQRESEHLDFEESKLFPKIEAIAGDKDWTTLEQELPSPTDPLFGLKQSDEYRDLYQALVDDERVG